MKKYLRYAIFLFAFYFIAAIFLRVLLQFVPEPYRAKLWSEFSLWIIVPILLCTVLIIMRIFLTRSFEKYNIFLIGIVLLTVSVSPICGEFFGLAYPSKLHSTGSNLAIRVPMNGAVKIAWGGDAVSENYHAAYSDQRWAYDLVVSPYGVGSTKNTDYGCFGKIVLAPISGEIRTAQDGLADRTPDVNAPDVDAAFGNYIVIKPSETDNRLIIAHLKNGSLLVNKGDLISEGTPIAQCGNSGNSTEPHVHIHLVALHELWGGLIMTGLPLYFRTDADGLMPKGGVMHEKGRDIMTGQSVENIDGYTVVLSE